MNSRTLESPNHQTQTFHPLLEWIEPSLLLDILKISLDMKFDTKIYNLITKIQSNNFTYSDILEAISFCTEMGTPTQVTRPEPLNDHATDNTMDNPQQKLTTLLTSLRHSINRNAPELDNAHNIPSGFDASFSTTHNHTPSNDPFHDSIVQDLTREQLLTRLTPRPQSFDTPFPPPTARVRPRRQHTCREADTQQQTPLNRSASSTDIPGSVHRGKRSYIPPEAYRSNHSLFTTPPTYSPPPEPPEQFSFSSVVSDDECSNLVEDVLEMLNTALGSKNSRYAAIAVRWSSYILGLVQNFTSFVSDEKTKVSKTLSILSAISTLLAMGTDLWEMSLHRQAKTAITRTVMNIIGNVSPSGFSQHSSISEAFDIAQESTATVYEIVRKSCILLVTVFSMAATGGDLTKMNYMITLSRFKNAVKDAAKEGEDLFNFIAEDICGFRFGDSAKIVTIISDLIIQVDNHLARPESEYGQDVTHWYAVKDLLKTINDMQVNLKDSDNSLNVRSLLSTLQTRTTLLLHKVDLLQVYMKSATATSRMDPTAILIMGEEGIGKTEFVNRVLVPRLAALVGLDPASYCLKMTPSNKYFPEYSNQPFFIFDEFLATKVNDPSIDFINSICSSSFYNMEGAFVKFQPCHAKIVFAISNMSQCVALSSYLSIEASRAFWRRWIPVRITHPTYDTSRPRHDQPSRQADWSHLVLTREEWDTSTDPKGCYTVNKTKSKVTTIDNLLDEVSLVYRTKQTYHLTRHTIKQSGGTSHFVIHLNGKSGIGKTYAAARLCKNLSEILKFPHFKVSTNASLPHFSQPSIVLADDLLDSYPLLYKNLYDTLPTGSIIVLTSNLSGKIHLKWSVFHGSYTTIPHLNIDGLIRRIGIPGKLYDVPSGTYLTVPRSESIFCTMTTRGIINNNRSKQMVQEFISYAYTSYITFLRQAGGVDVVEGIIPQETPDIEIKFDNLESGLTYLANPLRFHSLWADPSPTQYMTINNAGVFKGVYPTAFTLGVTIPPSGEVELVKYMADRFSEFHLDASVLIRVDNNSYWIQNGLVVSSTVAETFSWDINGTTITFHHAGAQATFLKEEVIMGIKEGFHLVPAIPYMWADKIMTSGRELLSCREMTAALGGYYKAVETKNKLQYIIENKPSVLKLIMSHPGFIIASSLAGLVTVASFATLVYRAAAATAPKTTPESIPPEQMRAFEKAADKAQLTQEQRQVAFERRTAYDRPLSSAFGVEEIEGIKAITKGRNVTKQSVYNFRDKYGSQQTELCDLIAKNIVHIEASSGSFYGIALRNNLILCPSHIFSHVAEKCTITQDHGLGLKTFQASVFSINFHSDLAILEVVDKTYPPNRNITRHFIESDDIRRQSHGFLQLIKNGTQQIYNCTFSAYPYFIHDTGMKDGAYTADFYESSCPTVVGSCGLPYFVFDNDNTIRIAGIHVGRTIQMSQGIMSIVSEDRIQTLLTRCEKGENLRTGATIVEPMYEIRTHEFTEQFEHFGMLDGVGKYPLDVPYIYTGIQPLFKMDYQRSLPNKPKYKKVPFFDVSEQEGFINNLLNTPCSLADVKYPEDLERNFSGPSIELTQVALFDMANRDVSIDKAAFKYSIQKAKQYLEPIYGYYDGCPIHRILSVNEAINGLHPGDPLYPFFDPIKTATAAGAYWKTTFKVNLKSELFIGDLPNMQIAPTAAGKTLENYLGRAWHCLMSGVRPLTMNTDIMKAELQAKNKTEVGKTRLFSVADIVEVILVRRLCGSLAAVYKAQRSIGPYKIGIDPIAEMTEIVCYLKKMGPNGWAADYKRFDKQFPFEFNTADAEVCGHLFGQKATTVHKALEIIAHMTGRSIHWLKCTLYMVNSGQNSGGYQTSMKNCGVNLLITLYCFNREYKERFGEFPEDPFSLFRAVIHGDDIVVAVKPGYEWFDVNVMIKHVSQLGMTILPGETGSFECEPIDNLWFLSRKMSSTDIPEAHVILPALKLSSFERYLHWTSDLSPDQIADNLNIGLDEASFHSDDYFEKYRNAVIKGCLSSFNNNLFSLLDLRSAQRRRADYRSSIANKVGYKRVPMRHSYHSISKRSTIEHICHIADTVYDAVLKECLSTASLNLPNNTHLQSYTDIERRRAKQDKIDFGEDFFDIETKLFITGHTLDNLPTSPQVALCAGMSSGSRKQSGRSAGGPPKTMAGPVAPLAQAQTAAAGAMITSGPDAGAAPGSEMITFTPGSTAQPIMTNPCKPGSETLMAGGSLLSVQAAAYAEYYSAQEFHIDSDTPVGEEIFRIAYGLQGLNNVAFNYAFAHENYSGDIDWNFHVVGNTLITGELIIGFVKDINKVSYSKLDLQQMAIWALVKVNGTGNAEFVATDVRKTNFYRTTDEDEAVVARPGFVCLVSSSLTSLTSTNAVVTIHAYNKLDPNFIACIPKMSRMGPAPTPATGALTTGGSPLEGLTLGQICKSDTISLVIDGYVSNQLPKGHGFPVVSQMFAHKREVYNSLLQAWSFPGSFIAQKNGSTQETAYFVTMQDQHSSGVATITASANSPYYPSSGNWHTYQVGAGITTDLRVLYARKSAPDADFIFDPNDSNSSKILIHTRFLSGNNYTIFQVTDDTTANPPPSNTVGYVILKNSTDGGLPIIGTSLHGVPLQLISINSNPGSPVLPDDWCSFSAYGHTSVPTVGTPGLVTTLAGHPTVFYDAVSTKFVEAFENQPDAQIDFDIISKYTSTPVIRGRYIRDLKAIVMSIDRSMAYSLYNGTSAADLIVKNINPTAANSTLFPTKSTNFVSRVPASSTVINATTNVVGSHAEMFAVGSAVSGASSGLMGAFGKTRQYNHELEMQSNQFQQQILLQQNHQGFASDIQMEKYALERTNMLAQFGISTPSTYSHTSTFDDGSEASWDTNFDSEYDTVATGYDTGSSGYDPVASTQYSPSSMGSATSAGELQRQRQAPVAAKATTNDFETDGLDNVETSNTALTGQSSVPTSSVTKNKPSM